VYEPLKEKLRPHHFQDRPTATAVRIPVFQYGRRLAWLTPVSRAAWREPKAKGLLTRWLGPDAAAGREHLLFWVRAKDETSVGLVGLAHLDLDGRRVEITTAVRGVPEILPGVMYAAVQTLLVWAFQTLTVQEVVVRLAPDNAHALRLFRRCGFQTTRSVDGDPQSGGVLILTRSRSDWMAAHRLDRVA
jgi:RimJ/RimL family protein N-acetyltransferase